MSALSATNGTKKAKVKRMEEFGVRRQHGKVTALSRICDVLLSYIAGLLDSYWVLLEGAVAQLFF
jgi:hypothetical protein